MKLYLIRHGIAEDRHISAQRNCPDEQRPLTEKGRSRLKKIASSFYEHEPFVDIFFQSPLLRSQQSTSIFLNHYPEAQTYTTPHLQPGFSCESLFSLVKTHFDKDAIALVGHEPDLGQFLSWLLFDVASERFPLKKGASAISNGF